MCVPKRTHARCCSRIAGPSDRAQLWHRQRAWRVAGCTDGLHCPSAAALQPAVRGCGGRGEARCGVITRLRRVRQVAINVVTEACLAGGSKRVMAALKARTHTQATLHGRAVGHASCRRTQTGRAARHPRLAECVGSGVPGDAGACRFARGSHGPDAEHAARRTCRSHGPARRECCAAERCSRGANAEFHAPPSGQGASLTQAQPVRKCAFVVQSQHVPGLALAAAAAAAVA
jgi:hypothetical protein